MTQLNSLHDPADLIQKTCHFRRVIMIHDRVHPFNINLLLRATKLLKPQIVQKNCDVILEGQTKMVWTLQKPW